LAAQVSLAFQDGSLSAFFSGLTASYGMISGIDVIWIKETGIYDVK
jgi:hypothetical protein